MHQISLYNKVILVVEDSDEDFEAITRAFKKLGVHQPLHRCSDGLQAYAYLVETCLEKQEEVCPVLVLLDLNMPKMDGKSFLRAIKEHKKLCSLPIIILTSSENEIEVAACYQHGANAFLTKAHRFNELVESLRNLKHFWLETAKLPFIVS